MPCETTGRSAPMPLDVVWYRRLGNLPNCRSSGVWNSWRIKRYVLKNVTHPDPIDRGEFVLWLNKSLSDQNGLKIISHHTNAAITYLTTSQCAGSHNCFNILYFTRCRVVNFQFFLYWTFKIIYLPISTVSNKDG